jgi:ribonuclease P protein component
VPIARANYPKAARLLRRTEYIQLKSGRPGFTGPAFLVVWQSNNFERPRLGVTASRKVGCAVVRNRIKRHIREFFRLHAHALPAIDINIIVRSRAADLDGRALRKELNRFFQQIGRDNGV